MQQKFLLYCICGLLIPAAFAAISLASERGLLQQLNAL